jgi:hypothetical protein
MAKIAFRAVLLAAGKTATGFEVPPEVVAKLGISRKPAVHVSIGKYRYRSTVATMGGKFMLGVSAEHRAGAGVAAGDMLRVSLELDTAPRVVTLPADFQKALDHVPAAFRFFGALSYSHKRQWVLSIEGAKTAETRARRIGKAVDALREGRKM